MSGIGLNGSYVAIAERVLECLYLRLFKISRGSGQYILSMFVIQVSQPLSWTDAEARRKSYLDAFGAEVQAPSLLVNVPWGSEISVEKLPLHSGKFRCVIEAWKGQLFRLGVLG